MKKHTSKNRFLPLVGLLALVLLSVLSLRHAQANVKLTYFDAIPLDNAVRLEWSTETELDTAGFLVKRSSGSGAPVTLDNIGFIDALGDPVSGNDYEAVDDTAVNSQTYTYTLFEMETNGSEIELESKTITLDADASPTTVVSVNTPQATAVPSSATQTPTTAPTATQSSTATSRPATATATRVSVATATPRPSATPTTQAQALPTLAPTSSPTIPATLTLETTAPPPTDINGNSDDSRVLAQDLPTNTPPADTSYPDTQPTAVPDAQPTAYPANATPAPITSSQSTAEATIVTAVSADAPAQTENPTSTQELIFLWGGFLSALFLFIISIVGSILLFTRRRE